MVHKNYNVKKLLALKKKTGKQAYVYCEDFKVWVTIKNKYIKRMNHVKVFCTDEISSGIYVYPTIYTNILTNKQ